MVALTASQNMTAELNLTLKYHHALNSITKEKTLKSFCFCANNGIKGNEIANVLAKLKVGQPLMGPKQNVKISYEHNKEYIRP